MEPADLNSPSRDDARLEALLRRPTPALANDGFSARVLAALPAPVSKTERMRWRVEIWSAILGAIAAVLGVLFWPGANTDVAGSLRSLAQSVAAFADPMLLAAMVVAAGCVLFALKPQWRRSGL